MRPLISVIMPVYNCEKYVAAAINSILLQTYSNFEFIIINDGSRDGTSKILEDYSLKDPRIILIARENKGLIASLNEGIERAKGVYIARMDADDISCPRRFEAQLDIMEKSKSDICGCHWHIVNENGKYIDAIQAPLTYESFVVHLSHSVPFAHGSVMIRKDFLTVNQLKYGFEGKNYAEDYQLWLAMFRKNAKFINANEFLFEYRLVTGSLSNANLNKNKQDAKRMGTIFVKEYYFLCRESLTNIVKQSMSVKEQEWAFLLGFRMLIVKYDFKSILDLLKYIPSKRIPNLFLKAFYNTFM